MIKLICLVFMLAAGSAGAQSIQYTQEVAKSSMTIYTVAVGSAPVIATENVDITSLAPTGKLTGAYAIEIFNVASSTNAIVCSQDVRLSNTLGNKFYGREIAAGTGVVYNVLQGSIIVYCQSKSTAGITYATVSQVR